MKKILLLLALFLIPLSVWALSTSPAANDASTVEVWRLDGTTSSAAKLDGENGNDLTEGSTAPTATTGQVTPTSDGAANFTGAANEYYTAGDLASFPTGSFTIHAMMQIAGTPTDTEGMITKYDGVGQRTFYIQRNTDNTFVFGVSSLGSAFTTVTTPSKFATGKYYCVDFKFEASTELEIFVDGVSTSSNTTLIPATVFDGTSPLDLGNYAAFRADSNTAFTGILDDVMISNIARSDAEIDATCNVEASAYSDSSYFFIWEE